MSRDRRGRGPGEQRAASELVGVVLLFGMVAVAVIALLLVGLSGTAALEDQQQVESAELTMRDVDATLSSVASGSESRTGVIEVPERPDGNVSTVRNGSIQVTVNRNPSCRLEMNMTSFRYGVDDGTTVVYEGSGVWKDTEAGISMVSPPGIEYRDGYVRLSLVNLVGEVQQGEETTVKVSDGTNASVEERKAALYGPSDCRKPHTFTIAVTSDYYEGWERYLRDEMEGSVTAHDSNRTVVVTLNESSLPPDLYEPENAIIDFSESDAATHDGNNTIVVGQNHTASMKLLGVQQASNRTRLVPATDDPFDTVFVIDSSGSMDETSNGTNRLEKARAAAKRYVGIQQSSPLDHRAGVVDFDIYAGTHYPVYDDITVNLNAVNQSIDNIPSPNGGTKIEAGLDEALDNLALYGNSSHNRTIILVSDGCNSAAPPCNGNGNNTKVLELAEDAADRNVTIHTVAITGGSANANETLMNATANRTGGSFYNVNTASELDSVFENIASATTRHRIAPAPVSANLSIDGSQRTLAPDGSVANGTTPNESDDLNGNAGAVYDLGVVSEGSEITVDLTTWDCSNYAVTGTVVRDGRTYETTECTDVDGTTLSVRPTQNTGNLTFYTDGDAVPTASDPPWYHDDLEEILSRSSQASLDGGTLSAPENVVLVVVDLPGGPFSRGVFLYEAGIAPSEADFSYVLGIDVSEVQTSD